MPEPYRPTTVAAYYYPGFHADPARGILGNGGATGERALIADEILARAYPGVRRPVPPLQEPTSASIADEAHQALGFGINAFLWCWYWDRGELLFNRPLELYQQANLPDGFGYALMWTNKRPHFELPMHGTHSPAEHAARLVTTDVDDITAMTQHLVDVHFSRPDYLRIDGRPVLSIFLTRELMRQHGRRGVRRLLETANAVARRRGLPGIFFIAVEHKLRPARRWADYLGLGARLGSMDLRDAGFDAASTYVFLPHWDGPAAQSYETLVEDRPTEWATFERRVRVPLWPSVSPGWDARLRGVPCDPLPEAHPWAPLIRDESPAAFARLLATWRRFAEIRRIPLLTVASWNEWTEGHAVAPCDKHGEGFLEALRAFMSGGDIR